MNSFTFEYPTKVYFGNGSAKEKLPDELKKYGNTVMLTYGTGAIKSNGIYDEIISILKSCNKRVVEFSGIMSNPTYKKVCEGVELARSESVDFILAVGGGSVIDCSKIISTGAKVDYDIWEAQYEKHIRQTQFIPMGAVVTAFGTGAEMNNGAVITNEALMQKAPLWGAFYDFAVLEPAYTMTMPIKQVISGAFDTLSHCMETYFGTPHNDNLSDDINEAVMRNVIKNIRLTLEEPDNMHVRGELIWAAAMAENGILKLGKVTDFQCHMLEHQLGAYTNCNHGFGLAILHPVLYRHIYKDAEERFARFAKNVWGKATAEEGIDALADFIKEVGLPTSLSDIGITDTLIFEPIAKSTVRTTGCCKRLSDDELVEILNECK